MTSVGPDLTKRDWVVEHLRNEILSGRLQPGMPLLQEDIARAVGVSATPVREALSVLESEGLVERRPHRGVVIADSRFHDLEEVYAIRAMLEARAAGVAATRNDSTALTAITLAIASAADALRTPDIHRFRQANLSFHAELIRASGSRTIIALVSMLQARSTYYLRLDAERMARIHKDHERILELVRKGEASEVSSLVARHLHAYARLVPLSHHDVRSSPSRTLNGTLPSPSLKGT